MGTEARSKFMGWLAAIALAGAALPVQAEEIIWLMPRASNTSQQGFIRVSNLSYTPTTVTVYGVDDAGAVSPTASFSLAGFETKPFNSFDLENGNPSKGLSGSIGFGTGNWRLHFESPGVIQAGALIRTPDGFLTSVHDPDAEKRQLSRVHYLQTVNPAENVNQVSVLRFINPSNSTVVATIYANDDAGDAYPVSGEVTLTLRPRGAVEISSAELEQGVAGKGLAGRLGNGSGKWYLQVAADAPIKVMNLLFDPKGYLTELPVEAIDVRTIGMFSCADFAGAMVFSQEPRPVYLGFFGSASASDSIGNAAGAYGSTSSATSMRNPASVYGSTASVYSANYGVNGTYAPVVMKDGKVFARITPNSLVPNGVSLAALDACDFTSAGARSPW